MKKILLTGLSLCITGLVFSQSSLTEKKIGQATNDPKLVNAKNIKSELLNRIETAKKTRSLDGRYYNYVNSLDTFGKTQAGSGLFSNDHYVPTWNDSSILQRYSSGLDLVNYRMVYNIFDPTSQIYNDPTWNNAGDQAIRLNDAYVVDTIWVAGAYIQDKPTLTNDKLVMDIVKSQAPDAQFRYYNIGQSFGTLGPKLKTSYYASTTDTSYVGPTLNVDTTAVKAGGSAALRTELTYNFVQADTNLIKYFMFVPTTPIAVNAGENIGFSLKFLSGDTWVPNVDTLNGMNRYLHLFYEETAGELMTYRTGSAGGGDLSTSGLMFSNDNGDLYPSSLIEGFNSKSFSSEHLDVIYHAKSLTAWAVSINGVSKTIANINVLPNPAANNAIFSAEFVTNPKNVKLQITNTMGQVVKTQELNSVNNAVKFNLDVTSFAKGMYIYTFIADGQNQSGKFSVN